MSHQDLSISFHKIAVATKSNCTSKLNEEELCRSIYSRLYYSLFHKYLQHDIALSKSRDPSKHSKMMSKLNENYCSATIQIYKKMLNLRIWSDYNLENHIPPGATTAFRTIDPLLMQISFFINKKDLE